MYPIQNTILSRLREKNINYYWELLDVSYTEYYFITVKREKYKLLLGIAGCILYRILSLHKKNILLITSINNIFNYIFFLFILYIVNSFI